MVLTVSTFFFTRRRQLHVLVSPWIVLSKNEIEKLPIQVPTIMHGRSLWIAWPNLMNQQELS